MSDQTPPRTGTAADRKISASTVTGASTGAAGLASTILWVLGCIKGHQYYQPDDALVLYWAALMVPTLYALKLKWDRYIGVSDQS